MVGQLLRRLLSAWPLVDHTFSHLNANVVLWQQDFANIIKKSVELKTAGLTYSEQERGSAYAGVSLAGFGGGEGHMARDVGDF